MAFEVADRIQETSTTTSTGTYTLDGAATGFQAFSVLGAGALTSYFATDDTNWEVGLGTVGTGPATLARTTILASSNAGSAVNWGTGTRRIYCSNPASLSSRKKVVSRSSNTILGATDGGLTVLATSTFTQTFAAVATLGDGWFCRYRNDGTGIITFDPNASEQINGATTLKIYPGESCLIVCDGSALKALFLTTGSVVIATATASASSSVAFTTGIDSNFEKYQAELRDIRPSVNAANLVLRVTQGGTVKSGSTDYAYTGAGNNDGGAVSVFGTANSSSILVATNLSTEQTRSVSGDIKFWNPSGTAQRKLFNVEVAYEADTVGSTWLNAIGAFQNGVAAIDGISFAMSTGNIASGAFTVRGYRRG